MKRTCQPNGPVAAHAGNRLRPCPEPIIEEAVAKAIANAAEVSKRYVAAATGQMAGELRVAIKG